MTSTTTLPDQLYRSNHYGKTLKAQLSPDAFKPAPGRVFFGLMHVAIVAAMAWVCLATDVHWAIKVLCAVVAGQSQATLGFFAHEVWHGSVFKRGPLEHFMGHFFSLLNMSSGTAWKIWHNDTHHKHTQVGRVDPDAFPYLDYVRTDRSIRAAQMIIPGYGGPLSYLATSYTWILKYRWATWELLFGRTHGNAKGQKTRIVLETVLMTLPWVAFFYVFGLPAVVYVWLIPAAVGSCINILYIHTNHHLSPRTPVNDPLINSLSVTLPPFLQWFHGNFGFHVEHHIFPSMGVRHARALHEILKRDYPERYQVMPLFKAIRLLFSTGTAYTDDGERLVNVRTGETRWTLRPGRTDMAAGDTLTQAELAPLAQDSVKKRNARDGRVVMAGDEDAASASAENA